MYTFIAVIALSSSVANLSTTPTWTDDYGVAARRVAQVHKPMAVFVGSGKEGWTKVVNDGVNDSIKKLLAQKYVCVYVDRDTAAGKALADQFQVASRGLIISDKAGSAQAYSLSGSLTRTELVAALEKYADKDVAVTESVVREAPAVAQPAYVPQYRYGTPYRSSGST
jgi:hypothetical protein